MKAFDMKLKRENKIGFDHVYSGGKIRQRKFVNFVIPVVTVLTKSENFFFVPFDIFDFVQGVYFYIECIYF